MKLYDTLSGTKKDFAPAAGQVRIYVCGPNLYGPCHVGHAFSYVVFDVLRRYLEHRGYQVKHVQNFTDIEDRIIEVARQQGRTITDLAEQYIQRFLQEMDGLGIQRAHDYTRATQYIERMIEIVQALVANGHAYAVDGDVHFRVRSFPTYGQLSKRRLDDMEAGARIEVDARKEDPMDFVLWKATKEGEPSWPSPWGLGRPGWHIECTAMSTSLLGKQLDIHGGGQDLVFPHHENEIAQAEAYTGVTPFVRFWVHNGLLRLTESDDEKMTRHSGNFVSIRDALARYHPDAIRLFLLSSHYRSPRAYSEDEIVAQQRGIERMRTALRDSPSVGGGPVAVEVYQPRFEEAMDDDLNTPRALAVLFDLAHDINRGKEESKDVRPAQAMLRKLGGVLGLTFQAAESQDNVGAQPFIELLVETRSKLREAKQFALADSIRARLTQMGVALEDSPQGTTWRFQRPEPA
ncbi:MAG: cysteine--tRNA ligase [Dehalococcoidia bacterium]|nr:cysteine--tRNA ligase [Dehalococcoidia bacterium]